MAHNLTTELVATTTMTTGYVWDIDALVMLQAAAEDFLNGLTEVQCKSPSLLSLHCECLLADFGGESG